MDRRWHSAMDWKQFENSLLKGMPFIGKEANVKNIEDYVQKAIKTSMAIHPNFQPFLSKDLDYDLFETHRSIFVRCQLPDGTSLKSMKFFVNKRKLRIEYSGKSEEISLPGDVNTGRIIARIHDGVLEIRMPKSSGNSEPFREIFIHE